MTAPVTLDWVPAPEGADLTGRFVRIVREDGTVAWVVHALWPKPVEPNREARRRLSRMFGGPRDWLELLVIPHPDLEGLDEASSAEARAIRANDQPGPDGKPLMTQAVIGFRRAWTIEVIAAAQAGEG